MSIGGLLYLSDKEFGDIDTKKISADEADKMARLRNDS